MAPTKIHIPDRHLKEVARHPRSPESFSEGWTLLHAPFLPVTHIFKKLKFEHNLRKRKLLS